MLVVLAPVFVAQLVTFKCDIADSAKCLQASPLLLLGNETNGADATVWPHGSELLGDLSPSPPPPPPSQPDESEPSSASEFLADSPPLPPPPMPPALPDESEPPLEPPPAECNDSNPACKIWAAKGECAKNPFFMRKNCCWSCRPQSGAVLQSDGANEQHPGKQSEGRPPEVPVAFQCEDRREDCSDRAERGECKSDASVLSDCCQSCDAVASRISKLACVDTFADCQAWARTGECERNPGLMRERCCNACSDIDRFGKDTCPAEADSAACEVRVKQGQCISNPRAIADECCRSCLDWQDGTMHCADTAPTQCGRWAAEGECHANPGFMTQSCCGTCTHPCCADPNCVPPPP
ncbi:hypothetical protein EMIHUDRAFT_99258 [Emiliania huxleyi CCMP1516]|uniref:ShKT domain-containing protein n=2 Tax=Emiliania huxleyi TaxID=2903 RepID=A0A0D3K5E8_EMIH1|nr:hypothetical protein EMIHUDRAFT_99258 [Emiliania huxleyi CCMP1516]EOD30983.1 hypothetical protein EMIHUDRAFT_99258 [Emiliania huxleyi CCMP1516]|eukprot:XP_005783412.1 hypothetical protein EMIHUDRAFT_99258 [Emiliania huxleyi CCMP1516]